VDSGGHRATLVYSASGHVGGALPLGWSTDERRIYFNDMRDIYSISAAGGEPRKVVTLPVSSEQVLAVAMVPGGRAFVVAVEERRSDVWMVENFDPDRPRRASKSGGPE
jgi:hypothetical protein